MRRTAVATFIACLALGSGCAGSRTTAAPLQSPKAASQGGMTVAADPAQDSQSETREVAANWIGGAATSQYLLAGAQDQAMGLWVDVPQAAGDVYTPMALTLAIDTSGSMRGDKIDHARASARKLIEELRDGDMVSIVTFADSARVLVSPTIVSRSTRHRALAMVEELSADGGTALEHGLRTAQNQLWHTPASHLVKRVVVISDGKATVGQTSAHALGSIAEHGMNGGVQVTSLGVGLDYDELLLNELAIRSSGRLYHLAELGEMSEIVEDEMKLLKRTAAADAKVEVVLAPGVQLVGMEKVRHQRTQKGFIVPLGAMYAGQQRELLAKIRLVDTRDGRRALASIRFHFKDPQNGGVDRVQESVVASTLTHDTVLVAKHENSRTQTIITEREAASLASTAYAQANAGNLERADRELDRAEAQLIAGARQAKSQTKRDEMMRSAKRLKKARKGLKAASKATGAERKRKSRAVSLELNDAAMDALDY